MRECFLIKLLYKIRLLYNICITIRKLDEFKSIKILQKIKKNLRVLGAKILFHRYLIDRFTGL